MERKHMVRSVIPTRNEGRRERNKKDDIGYLVGEALHMVIKLLCNFPIRSKFLHTLMHNVYHIPVWTSVLWGGLRHFGQFLLPFFAGFCLLYIPNDQKLAKRKAFGRLLFYLSMSSTIGYHTLTDLFENFLGCHQHQWLDHVPVPPLFIIKKRKSTTVLVIIINVQYYKSNDTPNFTNNEIACYD